MAAIGVPIDFQFDIHPIRIQDDNKHSEIGLDKIQFVSTPLTTNKA